MPSCPWSRTTPLCARSLKPPSRNSGGISDPLRQASGCRSAAIRLPWSLTCRHWGCAISWWMPMPLPGHPQAIPCARQTAPAPTLGTSKPALKYGAPKAVTRATPTIANITAISALTSATAAGPNGST
nr:hypothetical protein [Paenibacillus anseongense]